MHDFFYDHDRKTGHFRAPDLLRRKPSFVGNVTSLPRKFSSRRTLKVAVPFGTDEGPGRIDNAEIADCLGQAIILASVLNGREFFENWVLVYGKIDDFGAAGVVHLPFDRRQGRGRPALIAAPLLVGQKSQNSDSSYTTYQREALAVVGAQLYLVERLLVGKSGIKERAGTSSGVYEHLSPKLSPLRPFLRGSQFEQSGKVAEEDRLLDGDIGPDDKVYRFLLRTGSGLVSRLYGPLYGGTTRAVGNAWLRVGRKISTGDAQDDMSRLLAEMTECLPAAIDLAVNALSRHAHRGDIHLKPDPTSKAPSAFALAIHDGITERLLRPHTSVTATSDTVTDDDDAGQVNIETLTKLSFFWGADPVPHLPELEFWSSHFAAARFLGVAFRSREDELVTLQPEAHWGILGLDFSIFDSLFADAPDQLSGLQDGTGKAREWLRAFGFDLSAIIAACPEPISPLPGLCPALKLRAMRHKKGRP